MAYLHRRRCKWAALSRKKGAPLERTRADQIQAAPLGWEVSWQVLWFLCILLHHLVFPSIWKKGMKPDVFASLGVTV